jgi:hypothetical protein
LRILRHWGPKRKWLPAAGGEKSPCTKNIQLNNSSGPHAGPLRWFNGRRKRNNDLFTIIGGKESGGAKNEWLVKWDVNPGCEFTECKSAIAAINWINKQ